MILCDSEIRVALRNGQIVIVPNPPEEHFSTSAIDLRLSGGFWRWVPPTASGSEFIVDPSVPGFYAALSHEHLEPAPIDGDSSVIMRPGEFMLATTLERVELPVASRLAARVEGRSSFARLGLGIHVTAPTIHAGFRGQITLEITNLGVFVIKLKPGLRICQLVIEQLFGTPSSEFESIFQDQTSVVGKLIE